MARAFTLDTKLAHRACEWVCEHRELAAVVATLIRPDLPAPVARDGVQHTWASYSGSLHHVLLAALGRGELATVSAPAHLVGAGRDQIAPPEVLHGLTANGRLSVAVWPDADQDLVLTEPRRCVDVITRVAAARYRSTADDHPA